MAKRVIKLLGEPIQDEDRKAAQVITPGMLIDIDSNGDIIKHATAGGFAETMFALEREEAGYDIDETYAVNDTVKAGRFHRGTRVLALIASGQNIQDGEYLESAGNGTLRAYASGVRLCRSLEDVGAVTATTRLRCVVV